MIEVLKVTNLVCDRCKARFRANPPPASPPTDHPREIRRRAGDKGWTLGARDLCRACTAKARAERKARRRTRRTRRPSACASGRAIAASVAARSG